MAANGTPQSYLAQFRPTNNVVDNSMAQDQTSSGNPQGYVPQNQGNVYQPNGYAGDPSSLGRYSPPTMNNPYTQQWNTGGQSYNLPAGYGPYNNAGYQLPYFNQPGNAPNGQPQNQMQTVMAYLQLLQNGGMGGNMQQSGMGGKPGPQPYAPQFGQNDTYMSGPRNRYGQRPPNQAVAVNPATGTSQQTAYAAYQGQPAQGGFMPGFTSYSGGSGPYNAQPQTMNNNPNPAAALFSGTQTPAPTQATATSAGVPQPTMAQAQNPQPNAPYLPNLTYARFGVPRPQMS